MLFRRNWFFTIMRVVSMFFVVMVVAVVIALSQVNLETLRGDVLNVLRGATGVDIQIDGAVSWKFSLRPRIQLHQVRVRNAEWAHHEYAFQAETIDVTLDLISLFHSRPTIRNVRINDASVCIERNDAGEYSIAKISNQNEKDDDGAGPDNDDADADENAAPTQPAYPFVDPGLGAIQVNNLVVHAMDASYSLAGMDVRFFQRPMTREYAGWIKPQDKVYPFIVSFAQYDAANNLYPVRAAVSTGAQAIIANVALAGDSLIPVDFSVSGDVPDVGRFGDIFGVDLSAIPMLHIDIAGGYTNGKISLKKSEVVVRGTTLNISGDYDLHKKRPTFNLTLAAKNVNLMTLFPEIYVPSRRGRPNRPLNVFKDIPLFGTFVRSVDANVRVDIDALTVYKKLTLRDVDIRAKIKQGIGRIDADIGIAGGDIVAGADVEIDSDGVYDIVMAAVANQVTVGKLLDQVGVPDLITDLPMGAKIYVRGRGANLAGLMATMTGPVQIYSSGSGYAHDALVSNLYGADFLTSLRHSIEDLFSSEKKHNNIKISCAAISAKIRNGRIETENGVAVETNAINLRLAGNLDFGAESMRLSLTTVPVRGLKLSLTGNVMNSVEITGTLAEPDIKISGAAVAGKVASATGIGLLLAPFTGGISLAAGAGLGLIAGDLLENWLADEHPCKTALAKGAPDLRHDPEWLKTPIGDLIGTVLDSKNK